MLRGSAKGNLLILAIKLKSCNQKKKKKEKKRRHLSDILGNLNTDKMFGDIKELFLCANGIKVITKSPYRLQILKFVWLRGYDIRERFKIIWYGWWLPWGRLQDAPGGNNMTASW